MRSFLRLLGAAGVAAGCGAGGVECVAVPCALPMAITARVVDQASGAPIKVHVTVSGGLTGSVDCDSVCYVPGGAGVYHLAVSASGYAPSTTDVTVVDAKPTSSCGCEQVVTQSLTIALTRTS